MAVKTNGAEWKRFYQDEQAWPDGWWHEDEEISVNGVVDCNRDLNAIGDTDAVVVRGGIVFPGTYDKCGPSLEAHFKKWRQAQMVEIITVEVRKGERDKLRVAIAAAGGKIIA